MISWWRTLAPPLKAAVGLVAFVAVAGALYLVVTLVLIGLGDAGIGETCRPGC